MCKINNFLYKKFYNKTKTYAENIILKQSESNKYWNNGTLLKFLSYIKNVFKVLNIFSNMKKNC